MEHREIVVIGSGPAGSATALRLLARDRGLAADTVVLEKACHPRDKTCAGGLIPKGRRLLDELGVELTVPQVRVDGAMAATPGGQVAVVGRDLCRVVRRRELDALLAGAARARGIELRENERVVALTREAGGIRVETERRTYWARVVVGADGSGSLVRRTLVPGHGGVIARALMADVPVAATAWDGHAARRYDFDFRSCPAGLRGYRWSFPCLIDGVPHANVGVYALPPTAGAQLQRELAGELARIGASATTWKAFPIHTYDASSPVAAPHALLVGDAAGCDPLMGEGISFALEYGMLAADAIIAARARNDWSFVSYERAVHRGPIGRKLRRLGLGTRLFYGRHGTRWFRLAAASRRAQAIGLAWYNGVDGWDERGAGAALAALFLRRGPAARAF